MSGRNWEEWRECGWIYCMRKEQIKEKRKREKHEVDDPRHEAAFDANSVTEQRLSREAG